MKIFVLLILLSFNTLASTIEVSGSCSKQASPDVFKITASFVEINDDISKASVKNSVKYEDVLNKLPKGVKTKTIDTSTTEVYQEDKNKKMLYRSNITLEISGNQKDIEDTIRTLDNNKINKSGFTALVSEETSKKIEALCLKEAVSDAKTKASIIAEALNLAVDSVKKINYEPQTNYAPVYRMEALKSSIEPGENTLNYQIRIEFNLK